MPDFAETSQYYSSCISQTDGVDAEQESGYRGSLVLGQSSDGHVKQPIATFMCLVPKPLALECNALSMDWMGLDLQDDSDCSTLVSATSTSLSGGTGVITNITRSSQEGFNFYM